MNISVYKNSKKILDKDIKINAKNKQFLWIKLGTVNSIYLIKIRYI